MKRQSDNRGSRERAIRFAMLVIAIVPGFPSNGHCDSSVAFVKTMHTVVVFEHLNGTVAEIVQ